MPNRETWRNWLGQHPSTDVRCYRPRSLDEVSEIVSAEPKLKVVGAGHADNEVARPNDGTAMLDPRHLDDVSREPRTDPDAGLVRVGAGASLRELNERLASMGRAMPNLGSFDGQTVSGAIGTGTHGAGSGLGPLCDYVRAVEFVDGRGQAWRVDDPDHEIGYTGTGGPLLTPGTRLAEGDRRDLFRSLGVHVGSLGVVTSLVLETLPAYQLWERRRVGTWEGLSAETLLERAQNFRHYEIAVVAQPNDAGKHVILETFRDLVKTSASGKQVLVNRPATWPKPSPLGQREALLDLARFGADLASLFQWRREPQKIGPRLISSLETLSAKGKVFVGPSDQILMLKLGARAHGFEVAIPVRTAQALRDAIDQILVRTLDWDRPGEDPEQRCVSSSPFALRFVKGSPQFLAPQSVLTTAGPVDLWCMVEIPRLAFDDDQDSTRFPHYPHAAVLDVWHDVKALGGRAHWGQKNFLQDGDLPGLYPGLGKWQDLASQYDPDRRFVNAWARRVGLR